MFNLGGWGKGGHLVVLFQLVHLVHLDSGLKLQVYEALSY
jgi:hypothetical protein